MMNFGKSRAKMSRTSNINLEPKVAGLQEEKEELEEIVDFLKTAEIHGSRRKDPKGRYPGGPSSVLFDIRFGFRGDVCRRGRITCP